MLWLLYTLEDISINVTDDSPAPELACLSSRPFYLSQKLLTYSLHVLLLFSSRSLITAKFFPGPEKSQYNSPRS